MKTLKTVLIILFVTTLAGGLMAQKVKKIEKVGDKDVIVKKIKIGSGEDCGLDLTEKQEKSFKKLSLEHRKTMIGLNAKLEALELDMEGELDQDSPSQSNLQKVIDEKYAVKADIAKEKLALQFKKFNLLDKEQKEKWHWDVDGSVKKQVIMINDGDGMHKEMMFHGMDGFDHSDFFKDFDIDVQVKTGDEE